MLSRILISTGLKTGTYISPFVEDFRERICINGEFIEKETLINLTERVAAISSGMDDFPNAFEQITAIALTCFKEHYWGWFAYRVPQYLVLVPLNIILIPVLDKLAKQLVKLGLAGNKRKNTETEE